MAEARFGWGLPCPFRTQPLPNLSVTGHQAFFTEEAIGQILQITIDSISAFERGEPLANRIPAA